VAHQIDLWGHTAPPQGLSEADRVAYLLDRFPECRDDDRLLILAYWREFDCLEIVLGDACAAFEAWFRNHATHPETIRRRRQEHQRLDGDHGHLRPGGNIIRYRRKKSHAGPVR